ncbi:MAG: sodium/pantothenate symporter [Enterovibrio sp.]
MSNSLMLPLLCYLGAIFAIAFYTRKSARSASHFLEEYFLGQRSIGGFILAMTLAATYTSASSFIGGPGAAYQYGLGWVLIAMIQVPAAWVTLGVLGKKFAIEARKHNAITLNDMLYAKFKSRPVVIFTSITLLLAFLGAMTAQFVGGARLLQSVTGFSYEQGLMLFAGTVGIYTTIGGFRAVAITDAMQGLMMIVGTIALLVGVIHTGGGLAPIIEKLHHIDPLLISPHGANNMISLQFSLSFWVLICFGVIAVPPVAVRCMSYRSSKALHLGIVLSTTVVAFLIFGMHLSGALGRAVLPDLQTADQVMPELMMNVLPPLVAGIFLAGPMAAIMSTIDSQLIQSSATLLKDLYLNHINPQQKDDPKLEQSLPKLSMWISAIFLTIVFLAALNPPDMIIWLNLLAMGAMQTVFLWPLVLGLYWKKATAGGALASMVAGLTIYVALALLKPDLKGLHAIVPTLTINLLVFVGVSLYQQRSAFTKAVQP